jgi:hypothetical protein
MDMVGIAIGIAGGAVGKAAGDSKITGDKEWDKILGPVCAIAAASLYKRYAGGDELGGDQAAQAGALMGLVSIGIYKSVKGAAKFVADLFKRKKKPEVKE